MDGLVLALILGKGASTRIPLKNIVPVNGRPLIHYTFDHVRAMRNPVHRAVLTESPEVAAVCEEFPVCNEHTEIGPYLLRRVEQGVRDIEQARGFFYDYVLMLNADTPVRPPTLLDDACHEMDRTGADAVQSVVPVPINYHPFRTFRVSAGTGVMYSYAHPADVDLLSQDYPPLFALVGGCFLMRRSRLQDIAYMGLQHTAMHNRPIVCDPAQILEIDTPEDLERFRNRFANAVTPVP